jgi:predicted small metal-binding protein
MRRRRRKKMPKFLVKASYLQWCEIEVEADDEEDVYEIIDDYDLDEYKETDISDYTIDEIKEVTNA